MDASDEIKNKEEKDSVETSANDEVASDTQMDDEKSPQDAPVVEEPRQTPHSSAKDRTLREFLGMMDQYAPIIPDAVTDYYLALSGFECEDSRIKRLLALASQKFIADIAQDAYQYSKIRATGGTSGGPVIPAQPRGRYGKDRGRAVLTMDDLGSAVHEYGINLKRQDFMR